MRLDSGKYLYGNYLSAMATKSSLAISPLGDRVVVKPVDAKEEKVLASGIIIPET